MKPFGFMVALCTWLLLVACVDRESRPAEVASRQAAMPRPGEVRLLYRTAEEIDGLAHHTWTVLGERNWTKPSISGTTISLGNAYPLNSVHGGGGTHVWECTIRVPAPGSGKKHAQISLRGSHAAGISATVLTGNSTSPTEPMATLLVGKDITLRLPVQISLARLNDREVVLKIDR